MIEYRLTTTKKPALILAKIDEGRRVTLAELEGPRVSLLKQKIVPSLQIKQYRSWRDGRIAYRVEEDSAIRLFIAMRMIIGVRDEKRVERLVEAARSMDRGETLSWYSLYLKLGFRAVAAIRAAYN
jgi:hypothetical protein